jgi:MFS transporter, ACS family, D-galactonate transporter
MNERLEKVKKEGPRVPAPPWIAWRMVALLMALSFTNWFSRVCLTVADVPIMKEFSLTSTQIGALDFALLFAYTICMTPGGWFIDRQGPRLALIVMGLGSALFMVLTGAVFVGSLITTATMAFAMLALVRSGMGVFSAPIYPASGKLVANWLPLTRRAWANGLINGAAPLGMATSHVLFGYLIDTRGWREAFIHVGICTLLLALVWTGSSSDHPPGHLKGDEKRQRFSDRPPARWWTLLGNRSLVLLTLSYAAVGYFEYLFVFCTEYYFKADLKLEVAQSRWYSSLGNIAMGVTMGLGGLVTDLLVRRLGYRWGRAAVPMVCMLTSALSLLAATLTRNPSWTLVWFTLAQAAIGAVEGSCWSTAIELGGRRGGLSAGIFNTGGNVGGALAPLVTRGLGDLLEGWRPGFYLGSGICLAGLLLWFWIDPSERIEETA